MSPEKKSPPSCRRDPEMLENRREAVRKVCLINHFKVFIFSNRGVQIFQGRREMNQDAEILSLSNYINFSLSYKSSIRKSKDQLI